MSVYGEHIIVGRLKESIIKQLNIDLPCMEILLYTGTRKHIKKRHKDYLKYLDNISDIINNPDYIRVHPNEPNSVEMVKVFDDNILVAIKLATEGYLYISTLHDISLSKLENRLNSKRLVKFIDNELIK